LAPQVSGLAAQEPAKVTEPEAKARSVEPRLQQRRVEPRSQHYAELGKPVRIETSPSREASDRALRLLEEGRWDDAVALLREARSECSTGDAGRACRLLIDYSLGYSYQLEYDGRRDPELLEVAARFYQRVLEEEPAHPATSKNLALVRVLSGELAEANSDLERALELFREAAALNPESEVARRRILGVCERLGGERLAELLTDLDAWRERFPDLARRGYVLVVERTWREDPELADRALRSYVSMLASEDRVSDGALAGLPESWGPVAELRRFFADGEWSGGEWWRSVDEELRVDLARALGHEWLVQGRSEDTEACWSGLLRDPPRPLTGSWLDLYGDLAALYANRPELDPEGRRFEELENALFHGKGEAYRSEDLEAIQRFHTVLGLIYAERGRWDAGWEPKGAVFQLSHAIRTAEQRQERGEAPYQPQARLNALLAEGYRATGDDRAPEQYLEAARAYLDTDDVDRAAEMLSAARQLPAGERPEVRELEGVVRARSRLSGDPSSVCPTAEGLFAALEHSEPEFVSRQRFKTLSDCSSRTRSSESLAYSAGALTAAVDGRITLVGAADLSRMASLRDTLRGASSESLGLSPGLYSLSTSTGTGRIVVDVPSADRAMIYLENKPPRAVVER
jgi:tetratricopeptide (TPR) repeat protein